MKCLSRICLKNTAKILAAERIEQIRYGEEYKDYFWIIDKQPVMIMHPYRPDLIGTDLSDYQDPDGKLFSWRQQKS